MFSPGARRVGDWIVDPTSFQVVRGGEPLPLEPRAVRVLLHLMDNPGRLVTKEELFETVWPDTAVTDNALTRVVAQLRKSLGDDARQPLYIETVPTQGYRFIGQALPVEAPEPAPPKWLLIASGVGLLAFAGVAMRWEPAEPPARPAATPVQITTSAGLDASPAFSPDGAQLAYASDRSGSFEIYVRPVSGGREIQVTSDGGQNLFPTWSPDGQRIAYYSAKLGGIRTVPALGGTAVLLTSFGCEPAWSPDGKWIAFRAGGFQTLAPTEALPPLGSTIWIVSPDGGEPRAVTRPESPPGVHGPPSWSQDGRRILFSSTEWLVSALDQRSTLWTVNPDGSDPRKHLSRSAALIRPRLAPDGEHVYALGSHVFAMSRKDSDFGIYRHRLDGAGQPVEVVRTGTSLPRDLAISRDGTRIAYSVTSFSSNLWELPLDPATNLPSGEPRVLVGDTSFRNTMPAFSPDGSRIAYHARRRGSLADIMIFDRNTGSVSQITSSPSADMVPSWTPDGSAIVYSSARGGRKELRRFTLATGQESTLLTDSKALLGGRLSPDGKHLVYQLTEGGRFAVHRREINGSGPVRLSPPGASIGFPTVSRDNRWIAVEAPDGDTQRIGVMPFDGGPVEIIVSDRGQNWSHGWSGDSSRIAFAALRDGVWNLWWVTRDGKRQQRLTSNSHPRLFLRYPDWSPRGDSMVYELAETKGNIFVADLR